MHVVSDTHRPRIDVYSHHFTVSRIDHRVSRAITELSRGLVEWGLVRIPGPGKARFQRTPVKTYASAKADRSEVRFNLQCLEAFQNHLSASGLNADGYDLVVHPLYEPARAKHIWKSPKEPREKQIPVIEYFSQDINTGPRSRAVTAQPGAGKGLMAVRAIVNQGYRTAIVVKAEYLDKWEEELDEFLDLGKHGLMKIQGSKPFISLMNLALAGELEAKIILISNKAMQTYFKNYEISPDFEDMYPIHPEQFYEKLGVGIRLIDEVHQEFHLNFKQDTYAHVPMTISLSATLDSDQEQLNRMYRLMWPVGTRGPDIPYDRYIAVSCLWYTAEKPDKIRHMNAKRQYAHIEFENSIRRNKHMLAQYLKIPELVVRNKYVPNRQPGQKMLIFCSTIAMCTDTVEHLQQCFPQFSIARYVGEDDWEQLHGNDIVVSTIQSAGTAVDIKNLRYTLLTVALSSKQTNEQVMGRLRRLKDFPDVTPEFMFTSCRNIGKHMEYAMAKKTKLEGKALTFSQAYLPITV